VYLLVKKKNFDVIKMHGTTIKIMQYTCSKIFKVICKGTLKMGNKCRSINTSTIHVFLLTQLYNIYCYSTIGY